MHEQSSRSTAIESKMNTISTQVRTGEVSAQDLFEKQKAYSATDVTKSSLTRGILRKTAAFRLLITAVVTYTQMPASRKSKSDAEKIAFRPDP